MKAGHAVQLFLAIMKSKLFAPDIPIQVVYFMTYRCMLQCSFCYRKNVPIPEMTLEETLAMMDEFKSMGTVLWSFNGGEPLVHQDIDTLVSYSKELGFFTSMNTNGFLARKKMSTLRKIDHADISLDGNPEVHDAIRGKGAYSRAVDAVELLRGEGIGVTLMSVITKENLPHLDHMIGIAEKNKCGIKFQPIHVHPQDLDSKSASMFPSKEQMRATASWLIQQKELGRPIACTDAYLQSVQDHWPDSPNGLRCYAGRQSCNITPEGAVTPCCASVSEIEMPVDHLSDRPYREALDALPDMSRCQSCFYNGPLETSLLFDMHLPTVMEQLNNALFAKRL